MPTSTKSIYEEVVEDYLDEMKLTECELADAMQWGIRKGRLVMSPQARLAYHMRKARKALREKKLTLPSGRRVREWHHRKVDGTNGGGNPVQRDLWGNFQTWAADPDGDVAMNQALRQRCKAVKVDVKQIQVDRDGFNETRESLGLPTIQLRIKFTYG